MAYIPILCDGWCSGRCLRISAAIPYVKSKKKAVPAVALPEGARLVNLCPSCGAENPLDAEYCH